jgi:F-type H+-transporting ATPase subunit delta
LISSKVSKRYAKALLNIGQEDGSFQQYGKELREFCKFCRENKEFRQVVANQIFSVEDRKSVLRAVLDKSDFNDVMKNFLNLLLDKDRIGAIEEIASHYDRLTDEISGISRAEVITPRPLNEEARSRLQEVLGNMTKRRVKMELRQDESLIGGIIVRIGDLVLDGSVKAQLEGLKESLKRGEYS